MKVNLKANMHRRTLLAALLASAARPALGQGFAGLGQSVDGFALPDPAHVLTFPADHGPHPDFRIEWWYLTANMTDPQGRDLGLQWTLFRSALRPGEAQGWQSPQIWLGHAALTTPDSHHFAEKLVRGGTGAAGAQAAPFAAWIDDWDMTGVDFDTLRLRASGPDFAYDVALTAQGPLVFHGQEGYSVKSADGQASHYYSQPHYRLEGTVTLPGGPVPVTGQGWLDREWSSQPLAGDQSGWDWFSLAFDSGEKLMAFRLRGGRGDFLSATWIDPDGRAQAMPGRAVALTPLRDTAVAGRQVPTLWRLTLPAHALEVEVAAINPLSWMGTGVAYWEGPVRATGSHRGRGYLEMTGY